MISLFPLLLATSALVSDGPTTRSQVSRVAVATVTIIQAEPVAVTPPLSSSASTDRQYRQRDSVPMVDFF
jgi:hypothetical protein